ncbi:DUF1640 domain-containing protein [Sodalis sp.]|uniref:DUF1640 domain-containing protein n=1 Tax=Sodalis sp. (in: enterobacteria) TaxID=1898979 RepID=UPI003872BBDD
MGQVAFDTLQASEELQTAGLTSEQAKAISLVVRKSHEVADVATKADIVEVKHEIAEVNRNVADVRKDLSTEIADVRKDMTAGFDKINDKFEKLGMQMTIRLGLMVAAAVSIIAAILKT